MKIEGYEPLNDSTLRGKSAVIVGWMLTALTAGMWWVAWGDLPSGVSRPSISPELFSILTMGIFGLPGIFLLILGLSDLRRKRHTDGERKFFPHEPWRWDFAWHGKEAKDIAWQQAGKGIWGLFLAIGIIGPINYLVFTKGTPIFAKLGVGFFDALLLLSLSTVIYRLAAIAAHQCVQLHVAQFPLQLGEAAELTLIPQGRFEGISELHVTLRCVEETCEARRTVNTAADPGPTTMTTKIGIERFQAEQSVQVGEHADEAIQISFELPDDDALSTRLSDEPSLHWELLVEGRRRGNNLSKRYLLPIY